LPWAAAPRWARCCAGASAFRSTTCSPALPPGTLLANLLGGYLIGVAMAFMGPGSSLPPEWRLFVITGFLGGLTTFSTFSAEVTTAMQQGRMAWALATVSAHVLGSLALTFAGLATVTLLRR
jgi:CrcB protein